MATSVRLTVELSVSEGPTKRVALTQSVDAYSVIELRAEGATNGDGDPERRDTTIQLQPGALSDVRLLVILANAYDPGGEAPALQYEIAGEEILLDGPQLFVGRGMISVFGGDPRTLRVMNTLGKPVEITALVGRTA